MRWATSSTASASAPLPPPAPDGVDAMGRTNDAILYGGRVHLTVRGDDDGGAQLALQLPSRNSRDYGRSFADIFKEVDYDFYKIDAALFAPAEVWVSNLDSGNTWHAGALDMHAAAGASWLQQACEPTWPAHRDHDRRDRLAHAPAAGGVARARLRRALRRSRRLPHRHDAAPGTAS